MPPAATHARTRADRSQRTTLILLGVLVAVAIPIGIIAATTPDPDTPQATLTAAATRFRVAAPDATVECCATLTAVIDDDDQADVELAALRALLDRLGFSEAVFSRMAGTRALDGTQQATSPLASAWWSYHPDSGLRVVVEPASGG